MLVDWRDEDQVMVLVHTPGIPIEWVYAVHGYGWRRRKALRDKIGGLDPEHRAQLMELGRENAQSVVEGDGWDMLLAVVPGYAGAVPLWSQIELKSDRRSNAAIAKVLGVDWQKVRRWRSLPVFCPLTGVRLIRNRGHLAL